MLDITNMTARQQTATLLYIIYKYTHTYIHDILYNNLLIYKE